MGKQRAELEPNSVTNCLDFAETYQADVWGAEGRGAGAGGRVYEVRFAALFGKDIQWHRP